MRTYRALWLSVAAISMVTGTSAAQTDPLVEEMVEAVSKEQVTGYVQTLQDFGTRYTYTQGNTDAGDWLFAAFEGMGLEVERHSFTYGSHTEENIIARIPGSSHPDEIVVISGHFDSTSEQPYVSAPGADDDASAIAAVLEAARILKDYQFERTVEFICFNAEEQGRHGSAAVASDYLAAGKDLVAVLNSDMIGYWPTGWQRDLDVAYEPVSEWLADHVISACGRYVGTPIEKHLSGACRDDHWEFTLRGIAAVTNMDCWEAHNGAGESTPHYHRTTDTIETLNLDCMTQVVQVNVASLAELAVPLTAGMVDGNGLTRAGETSRLLGNRPNPFSISTEIRFEVPAGAAPVNVSILGPEGRLVRRLSGERFDPGLLNLVWDGRDEAGRPVPSGIYFVRLADGPVAETRKMVLAR